MQLIPSCRFCGHNLEHTFCDLGETPLSNSYLAEEDLAKKEPFFSLHAYVCDNCFLVQVQEFQKPEAIFTEYAYFSSYSESWLGHAKNYVENVTERFALSSNSKVVEIASNDGYLLQYFKSKGIPVLGIEPAANVAEVAIEKGIPTLVEFFNASLAEELVLREGKANLILGNNVLAHVPNLNDFIRGMKILLKSDGIITLEFPHLIRLVEENQFDTIYHEHFSYFSLFTIEKIFAYHGLTLFDVDEIPTHGGSIRIYARHDVDKTKPITNRIDALRQKEIDQGINSIDFYQQFSQKVLSTKNQIRIFFKEAKKQGKVIVGYGAPAKGNTLLNFCEIGKDVMDFTVDRNPYKQNRYLPGTHIPIKNVEKIEEEKPDYLFILPWNLKNEIIEQMGYIRKWGGRFVVPIPELEVIS